MVNSKRVLFVEGGSMGNKAIEQGISTLLRKEVVKMPKVIACGPDSNTADDFVHGPYGIKWVLIDLDGNETRREGRIQDLKLNEKRDSVFFMIQKMEAWFLSQPDILREYYSKDFNKLKNKNPQEIPNPDKDLKSLTRDAKTKGEYQKIKHGSELLMKLDTTQLRKDFSDFDNLIKALNQ